MRVTRASVWTESVFHVLAHVDARGIPASCYSPAWIAWVAARCGPASERALGDDLQVITRVAPGHDLLARAQAVAWIFDDARSARAAADDELASIARGAHPDALAIARTALPLAEVVRAAAELELDFIEEIEPISDAALRDLGAALDVVAAAASVSDVAIAIARPLGLRGRVLGRSVLVGCPGIGCDAEHAAWQAAHEATVREVTLEGPKSFADVERTAIARLRSRARAAGLGDAHARWLERLDLGALGPITDIANGPD